MSLTKRSTKGSALTFSEMDENFTHLGGTGTYHNNGIRIGPPDTVLEEFSGICDGQSITVHSGTYTLQNVTWGVKPNNHKTRFNRKCNHIYTPTGTSRVYYSLEFAWDNQDLVSLTISFITQMMHLYLMIML